MADEFSRSEGIDRESSQVEMDLLEALLEPEDAPYPWNPAEPESEAYFVEREQELLQSGWSEEEIAVPATDFLTTLDSLWSSVTLSPGENNTTDVARIQTDLQQRFAARVPQDWLDAIAYQAHQAFLTQGFAGAASGTADKGVGATDPNRLDFLKQSQKSMAQQLVQCVQELVPNWAEEDLIVLARPFAYAMRGTETEAVDSVLEKVQHQDWTALTEIEQARTGLAIARYALSQL